MIHSKDVVRSIPPVKGASKAVSDIARIRPVVCYVTGRPSTVDGESYEWLQRHDFPRREIVFQPDTEVLRQMGFQNGNEWRARVLEFLYPWIEGLLDDNEDLLRYMTGYTGRVYLFGISGQSENPNIVFCPDWDSVVKAVVKWK